MINNKKHLLILGGTSDIGIELAKYFLQKNWQVTIHGYSNLNKIKKIYKNNFNYIELDFSKVKDDKILKDKFKDNFNSVINLVGYIDNQDFDTFNINETIKTFKINTVIPMKIISILLKNMTKKNFGRILNCSSIGVKFGGGNRTFNYSFSKKASEFIPNSVRKLAKKNILFNVARLGVIDTKIHKKVKNKNLKKREALIPIGRKAKISEVVKPLYFLSSSENTYVTGEIISISGGE